MISRKVRGGACGHLLRSNHVKNLFDILESVPSVRGWTAVENGPNINGPGKVPTIEQLMNLDRSGLPSWLPSAPLAPVPVGRDPFGPLPPAPDNQGPPTKIHPFMAPDQPSLPQWIPSGPMAPQPPGRDPFGPIPNMAPRIDRPPIDVDPPSRPPEWMFGPPELADGATRSALPAAAGRAVSFRQPGAPVMPVEAFSSRRLASQEATPVRRLVSRMAK